MDNRKLNMNEPKVVDAENAPTPNETPNKLAHEPKFKVAELVEEVSAEPTVVIDNKAPTPAAIADQTVEPVASEKFSLLMVWSLVVAGTGYCFGIALGIVLFTGKLYLN